MSKIIILIVVLLFICAIWSLPLYLCTNLVLWLFHIPFHLTLFQSFGLCLLTTVIKKLLFKKEND